MRKIWVYYNDEDGKILAYSAREDPNFSDRSFILVPLDEMRKFYDGKESIQSFEILNEKLQKRDEYIYDESYINDKFFEIKYNYATAFRTPDADFRVVSFEDCIVIFPCDIDCENSEFRAKLEHNSVYFYFTKKDDPSILLKEATFDGLQTSLTVILDEKDFTIFVTNSNFTYSLEFV